MNRDEEFAKLFKMIDLMAEYSILKPGQIDKACKEKAIPSKYFPFTTLMAEAFFSIYSFSLLVKEALYSNASAILRTLIEQVSAVYVLANNDSALDKFIEIKNLIDLYENKKITLDEINTKYALHLSEKNIENFFDYGWSISFGTHDWGRNKIIRESKLDEVLEDFWYLNKFAHGQLSWYQLLRTNSKDVLDRHIARTIMICGKLFYFLCAATVKYFGETIESDDSYYMFSKIRTLYLNINTCAIRRLLIERFKNNEDVKSFMERYIQGTKSNISMLFNNNFDDIFKNLLAITCFRQMETILVMFAYVYGKNNKYIFDHFSLYELLNSNTYPLYEEFYNKLDSWLSFNKYKELLSKLDNKWGPFRNNAFVSQLDYEIYANTIKLFQMTDLNSYTTGVNDEGKKLFANLIEAYFKNDKKSLNELKYSYLFYGTNLLSVVTNYISLKRTLNINFDFGECKLKKGTRLFRIRKFEKDVDYCNVNQWSYNPKMTENRANNQGEAALYLGTTENICAIETHINKGEKYVVGEYEVTEDIKLGGFLDFEDKKNKKSFLTGVILNAFLIAPSRNEKNDKLFEYLDDYYKNVQPDDLQVKNAVDVDLPFKFAVMNKRNEYYKITNQLLNSLKQKYKDGIIYSSSYVPISSIQIRCSDMNVVLYKTGIDKIKFIKSQIKINTRAYNGNDLVKTLIEIKDKKINNK